MPQKPGPNSSTRKLTLTPDKNISFLIGKGFNPVELANLSPEHIEVLKKISKNHPGDDVEEFVNEELAREDVSSWKDLFHDDTTTMTKTINIFDDLYKKLVNKTVKGKKNKRSNKKRGGGRKRSLKRSNKKRGGGRKRSLKRRKSNRRN
jgi:predicted CopG family antitoxin